MYFSYFKSSFAHFNFSYRLLWHKIAVTDIMTGPSDCCWMVPGTFDCDGESLL